MKVICRGAESVIYLDNFEGREAIVKERIPKTYRIRQLDDKLRKERTRKEIKLLTEARKIGVSTPAILNSDENNAKIIMEKINGATVKEVLFSADRSDAKKVFFEIGKIVGKMHQNNIIHGDLTTSNMILKGNVVYFIDFSLGGFSARVEDKGIDLRLFSETLKSTHFKIADLCWHEFTRGYRKENLGADIILKKLKDIKKRVRYAKRSD